MYQRYYWIDLLKVFGIVSVVFVHLLDTFPNSVSQQDLLQSYFYFCVPIFIIISFFLSEELNREKFKENSYIVKFIRTRSLRLAIPYIVWTVFYFAIDYILNPGNFKKISLVYGWQGQYYLVILFQLTLIYPFIRLVKPDKKHIFGFILYNLAIYPALSYFSLIPGLTGRAYFFYWLFYVVFAIFIANNFEKIKETISKISFNVKIFLIVFLPCILALEELFLSLFFNHSIIDPYLRFSIFIISPILFLLFVDIFKKNQNKESKLIHLLSKYTLGIYCLHPFVLILIQESLQIIQKYVNIQFQIPELLWPPSFFILLAFILFATLFLCKFIDFVGGKMLIS